MISPILRSLPAVPSNQAPRSLACEGKKKRETLTFSIRFQFKVNKIEPKLNLDIQRNLQFSIIEAVSYEQLIVQKLAYYENNI